MRLASKPISSPGRTEKFPPPLMRFLRTNVGSRSRGRSRSSPMFVIRKKSTTNIETQEPSSPKVTCMGQVRVRRSKIPGTKSTRPSRNQSPGRRRCRCIWIRNSLSCYHFNKKFKKPKSLRTVWRKWILFFHVDFKGIRRRRRKTRSKTRENSSKFGNKSEDLRLEDEEEDRVVIEEANRVYASTSISSPPKNALLLTRSRSAPYRSSSLASRFWGSPLASSEETEQQKQEERDETEPDEKIEDEEEDNRASKTEEDNPASKTESLSGNSSPNSRTDPEMDPPKTLKFTDFDGSESESVRERFSSFARIEEVKATEDEEEAEVARPSILTRCKSEPARIAAPVDPELSFWKRRRLGFT